MSKTIWFLRIKSIQFRKTNELQSRANLPPHIPAKCFVFSMYYGYKATMWREAYQR
jgi:hypothetical protein